jgi:hypothetical protein
MEPRKIWSVSWTQPYSTIQLRPYLRAMQDELEASIETILEEDCEYKEATELINRIKSL